MANETENKKFFDENAQDFPQEGPLGISDAESQKETAEEAASRTNQALDDLLDQLPTELAQSLATRIERGIQQAGSLIPGLVPTGASQIPMGTAGGGGTGTWVRGHLSWLLNTLAQLHREEQLMHPRYPEGEGFINKFVEELGAEYFQDIPKFKAALLCIPGAVGGGLGRAGEAIGEGLGTAGETIGGAASAFGTGARGAADATGEAVGYGASALGTGVRGAADAAGTAISGVPGRIQEGVQAIQGMGSLEPQYPHEYMPDPAIDPSRALDPNIARAGYGRGPERPGLPSQALQGILDYLASRIDVRL